MKKGLFYVGAVVFCAAVISGSAFAWGSTKNIDEPSAKISAAEEAELSMPSADEVKSAVKSVKEAIADAANKSEAAVKESTNALPSTNEAQNNTTTVAANEVSHDAEKPAEVAATTTDADEKANTTEGAVRQVDPVEYCPDVSQLHKEDMLWYAKDGGWRSFDASFVDEIKTFSGAQWIGVEVGKVICMYKGKDASSFPVTIERDNLVDDIKPGTGKWGKDMGGYKHCESNSPKDCGFIMHHGKQKEEDVYKVLRGLKKSIGSQ